MKGEGPKESGNADGIALRGAGSRGEHRLLRRGVVRARNSSFHGN